MHKTSLISSLLCALLALASCASVDCSLDSIVVWTLTFFDSETGESVKIPHELTIEAEGAGIIYNRAYNVNSIELPMSNAFTTDTLHLFWVDRELANAQLNPPSDDEQNGDSPTEGENPDGGQNDDEGNGGSSSRLIQRSAYADVLDNIAGLVGYNLLYIDHDNHPHFDAIDCPAAVFHTITDTRLKPTSNDKYAVTIDSIHVVRPIVDYQDVENIRIYLNYHRPAESSSQAVRQ